MTVVEMDRIYSDELVEHVNAISENLNNDSPSTLKADINCKQSNDGRVNNN